MSSGNVVLHDLEVATVDQQHEGRAKTAIPEDEEPALPERIEFEDRAPFPTRARAFLALSILSWATVILAVVAIVWVTKRF